MPSNSDPDYFPDDGMFMWSGDSMVFQHGKMTLVGGKAQSSNPL
jgi:hypothetical protein